MDKAFVIPATFVVGEAFPANLPLADGSLKPIADCSQEEVKQAVDEIRAVVEGSQRRLRRAYEEHLEDLEIYAQLAAYLDRYDEWAGIREDGRVRPTIWSVDISEDKSNGR